MTFAAKKVFLAEIEPKMMDANQKANCTQEIYPLDAAVSAAYRMCYSM